MERPEEHELSSFPPETAEHLLTDSQEEQEEEEEVSPFSSETTDPLLRSSRAPAETTSSPITWKLIWQVIVLISVLFGVTTTGRITTAAAVLPTVNDLTEEEKVEVCKLILEPTKFWFDAGVDAEKMSVNLFQNAQCDQDTIGRSLIEFYISATGQKEKTCEAFLAAQKTGKKKEELTLLDVAVQGSKAGVTMSLNACKTADNYQKLKALLGKVLNRVNKIVGKEKQPTDSRGQPQNLKFQEKGYAMFSPRVQSIFYLEKGRQFVVLIDHGVKPTVMLLGGGVITLGVSEIEIEKIPYFYVVIIPAHDYHVLRIRVSGIPTDYVISTLDSQPTMKSPQVSFIRY